MTAWEAKVHLSRDGHPRCGQGSQLTADEGKVTCRNCLAHIAGTKGSKPGYQWADVKPCGTAAAYRRHLRRQGKPVRCETCLQGERRRGADRKARKRAGRETYLRAA